MIVGVVVVVGPPDRRRRRWAVATGRAELSPALVAIRIGVGGEAGEARRLTLPDLWAGLSVVSSTWFQGIVQVGFCHGIGEGQSLGQPSCSLPLFASVLLRLWRVCAVALRLLGPGRRLGTANTDHAKPPENPSVRRADVALR